MMENNIDKVKKVASELLNLLNTSNLSNKKFSVKFNSKPVKKVIEKNGIKKEYYEYQTNLWEVSFLKKHKIKVSDIPSLVNMCEKCINCINCTFSRYLTNCENCFDCSGLYKCKNCKNCAWSSILDNCENCFGDKYCSKCVDSSFSMYLISCKDCTKCYNCLKCKFCEKSNNIKNRIEYQMFNNDINYDDKRMPINVFKSSKYLDMEITDDDVKNVDFLDLENYINNN